MINTATLVANREGGSCSMRTKVEVKLRNDVYLKIKTHLTVGFEQVGYLNEEIAYYR
jgi:hypothetical protein